VAAVKESAQCNFECKRNCLDILAKTKEQARIYSKLGNNPLAKWVLATAKMV